MTEKTNPTLEGTVLDGEPTPDKPRFNLKKIKSIATHTAAFAAGGVVVGGAIYLTTKGASVEDFTSVASDTLEAVVSA